MTDSKPQAEKQADESSGSLKLTLIVCAVLIVVAGAVYWIIQNTQPEAKRTTETRETAMLVEVTQAKRGAYRPQIIALGAVEPARSIELSPRVRGEIVNRSPKFDPGAFVEAGEMLLEIDPADYRNAHQQRQSERNQAKADLDLEMGRQKIAESDFRLLEQLESAPEPGDRALVLRQPQLDSAKARLEFAEATLRQAQLDLERTAIKAPFDLQVIERRVDTGSQVAPGDELGQMIGIERYWVTTTVPLRALEWIDFSQRGTAGSEVIVRHRSAWPEDQSRSGRVERLIGTLNERTRLARILVTVDDPLALEASNSNRPAMLIGSILECRIVGREIPDVVRIDRGLLRGNETAWLMDENDQLQVADLDILFEDADYAYVAEGIEDGARIVTTNLSNISPGAPLRLKKSTP